MIFSYILIIFNKVVCMWQQEVDAFDIYNNLSHLMKKTNKVACAPSEDSDQPEHPPSDQSLRWAING